MNLRAKKENIAPENVLKDKTNVKKVSEAKEKSLKPASTTKILKENNATLPSKARKTTGTQRKKKSLPKPPPDIAPSKTSHCFGFSDEEDFDKPMLPYDGTLTSFDCSKPYRLSLYVRPSRGVRCDAKLVQKVQNWTTMNLSCIPLNNTNVTASNTTTRKRLASETVMSPDKTQWKVPFSSTPKETSKVRGNPPKTKPTKTNAGKKTKTMVQRKITDLLPPSPKRTRAGNAKQHFESFFDKSVSSSEEELATPLKKSSEEVASGLEPVEFPKPRLSARWYEKRKKPEPLAEPEDDRPTEVILEELSKSKLKKSKKADREEEEFEKWSATMNSEFGEIDQFEVSIE